MHSRASSPSVACLFINMSGREAQSPHKSHGGRPSPQLGEMTRRGTRRGQHGHSEAARTTHRGPWHQQVAQMYVMQRLRLSIHPLGPLNQSKRSTLQDFSAADTGASVHGDDCCETTPVQVCTYSLARHAELSHVHTAGTGDRNPPRIDCHDEHCWPPQSSRHLLALHLILLLP